MIITGKLCHSRIFLKVILSSPCLWPCFHPPMPSLSEVSKSKEVIKSGYAGTQQLMHRVRGNYSSCTCRSSENICSSSGGAQDRMKLSLAQKSGAFQSLTPPPKANVLFCRFFKNLTQFWTKLRVLVLC
jgi:hypothetical protein